MQATSPNHAPQQKTRVRAQFKKTGTDQVFRNINKVVRAIINRGLSPITPPYYPFASELNFKPKYGKVA